MSKRTLVHLGLVLSLSVMTATPSLSQEGMCGGLFSFLCPAPPPPPPPPEPPMAEPPPPAPVAHKKKKAQKKVVKQQPAETSAEPAPAAPK